jgi:hypothetical protein
MCHEQSVGFGFEYKQINLPTHNAFPPQNRAGIHASIEAKETLH